MPKIFQRKSLLAALKILLPALYLCMLAFIFSHSLQTGEQSSQTSSRVVNAVQEVVRVFAPQSPIATATGEAYDELHAGIRMLAHFTEFALLGVLACGCCLVYAQEKKERLKYLLIGAVSLVIVPLVDETLQSFTANRAAELFDVMVDFCGGCVGFVLTLVCFFGVWRLRKKREEKNKIVNT